MHNCKCEESNKRIKDLERAVIELLEENTGLRLKLRDEQDIAICCIEEIVCGT